MIKRLVFCFDGSWNRLSAPNPTNVVITGQSVTPLANDGTRQIILYGTGVGDKWQGGLFGEGLIDKIVDGYRRRLTPSSGRFAMIDDGMGFQLVRWRPSLAKQLGREIVGVVSERGSVSWNPQRNRGIDR